VLSLNGCVDSTMYPSFLNGDFPISLAGDEVGVLNPSGS
jgi:hypothetical protein